jgi:pilin isopeptide linkage protein
MPAVDGRTATVTVSTATAEDGANATFGVINYTDEGAYYYTITEAKGDITGMTYDTAAKYAKVVVEKSTTENKLVATVSYSNEMEGTYGNKLTVTNKYGKTTNTGNRG